MNISKRLIFNVFTRQAFDQVKQVSILGRRASSISLDQSFMLSLVFPLYLFVFISMFLFSTELTEIEAFFLYPVKIGFVPFVFSTFLLLNKDFFRARSIGKRHFGYKIIDVTTGETASELQCAIRNFTLIIWPFELLIIMVDPSRRLGDRFANTKVVDADREEAEMIMEEIHTIKKDEQRWKVILYSLAVALLFSLVSVTPFLFLAYYSIGK